MQTIRDLEKRQVILTNSKLFWLTANTFGESESFMQITSYSKSGK